MELSQENILLQNNLRKFAQKELIDKASEYDKKNEFPAEIIQKLAELGVLGAVIPEEFEGTALDMMSMIIGLEELSKVCASTSLIVATHNLLAAYPVVKFGNPELKKKYLSKLAFGELVGGFAEPAMTDVELISNGENIRLSGSCRFMIGGSAQGLYLILAKSNKDKAKLTALAIEAKTNGVKIKTPTNTIGMRAAGICEVSFEDAVVSKLNFLGQEGDGQKIYEEVLNQAKIGIAAIALGLAQISIEAALKYARSRIQFGEPIVKFGMVQSKLAEMTVNYSAAKLLVYDAAQKYD